MEYELSPDQADKITKLNDIIQKKQLISDKIRKCASNIENKRNSKRPMKPSSPSMVYTDNKEDGMIYDNYNEEEETKSIY